MINLLDLMGGHFHDKIVELIKAGKKCYTVNDSFNCKTTVKNMRVDHRNKQHNWFASIVVFERIDFSHLDNVRPLGDIQNFSNENYLLTSEEIKKLQSYFKVLVGRIFLEFFKQPQFAAVKKLVLQHILHRYTNEMSSKSEVFPLPIQFKDEKKICRCGRHLFVDYHVFHLGVTVDDKVQNYGLSLIELFIVLMQLNDTIHEGDGDRNVVKWKYLLWVFKANNKLSKYAIEGMYHPTSVKCMLTHQVFEPVIWGRGTNKKGKIIGVNMPNDLEMEHTIKSTKNLITSMRANKTEKAVFRSLMAVTRVSESLHAYDESPNVKPPSTAHTKKSADRDEGIMLGDLRLLRPFKCDPMHEPHPSFPVMLKSTVREMIDLGEFLRWLENHKRQLQEVNL